MVNVDAAELFAVDVYQTELFHWLTVDVGPGPSTLSTFIITDVFITP